MTGGLATHSASGSTAELPGIAANRYHPYHRSTHRGLVSFEPADNHHEIRLDAIVVPTARPVSSLELAAGLASRLDCWLVLLCSQRSTAADAIAAVAAYRDLRVAAVDIPTGYEHRWLRFQTSRISGATRFRPMDTSLKRNIGVLLARIRGWRRIAFLDDDVSVPDHSHLLQAAGLLDRHHAVGLEIAGYPLGYPGGLPDGYPRGFPDNSVVCHANREAGGGQDTFLGGGALAFGPMKDDVSFFPNVYNDDWFFLLNGSGLHPVALTGTAVQREYDPFTPPLRARDEEFGDVLAEGLFWLLDNGRGLADADRLYWAGWLDARRRFIDRVMHKIWGKRYATTDTVEQARCLRIIAALAEARARCGEISPSLCVHYLQTWRADLAIWHQTLDGLPSESSLSRAFSRLNLDLVHSANAP